MNHINNLSAESEPSLKNSMLLRLGLNFGPVCGLNMAKKINERLIDPKISLTLRCTNVPLPPDGSHTFFLACPNSLNYNIPLT